MASPEDRSGGGVDAVLAAALDRLRANGTLDAHGAGQWLAAARAGDADVLDHLAMALRESGDRPGAARLLERAVARNPRFARGWSNLGALRREARDVPGALVAFERALECDPDSRTALFNLAALSHAGLRPELACTHLARLVELEPADAGAFNLLGLAQCDANEVDAGIESLSRALALAPQAADIANNLGVALGYAGRFDEAREVFERAIACAPRFGLAWDNLVRTRRLTAADAPLVERLERLVSDGQGSPFDAVCLRFALAKACDDLDRTDDAFRHLQRANRGMMQARPYDGAAHERLVDRIIETCDERFVARCRELAVPDAHPVFVVGMPRSGTTLVEQLLGRSPGVHAAGELPVVDRAVARMAATAGVPFPAALEPGPGRDPLLSRFAREVIDGIVALGHGASRIVDKMPDNYLYLGLLHAVLPGATFVHCIRDPRDTGLSLFFHRFAAGHEYSYSLDGIASRYRSYRRLMTHWRSLMGGRLVEVDYDALVLAPDVEAERLCRATGTAWHAGSLEPVASATVRTASSWQVRQPITRTASGRWRRYEKHLGALQALCD